MVGVRGDQLRQEVGYRIRTVDLFEPFAPHHASFHPKKEGHAAIAKLVAATLIR